MRTTRSECPAKVEEVVSLPDAGRDGAPLARSPAIAASLSSAAVARRPTPAPGPRRPAPAARAPVHLPVGGEGKGVEEGEMRRHHVLGKPRARRKRPESVTVRPRGIAGDDVRYQSLVPPGSLVPGRPRPPPGPPGGAPSIASISPSSTRYPRSLTCRRPARELQHPVRAIPDEVAGPVQPRPPLFAEGFGTNRSAVSPAGRDSPGEPGPAGQSSPGTPTGTGRRRSVEHEDRGLGKGPSDRDGGGPDGLRSSPRADVRTSWPP